MASFQLAQLYSERKPTTYVYVQTLLELISCPAHDNFVTLSYKVANFIRITEVLQCHQTILQLVLIHVIEYQ